MDNDKEFKRQLDWADEKWEAAAIWIASYHQRAIVQHNKKAHPWIFQSGSLFLRRVFENIVEVGVEKLQAN